MLPDMKNCFTQTNVESFVKELLQGTVNPSQDFVCNRSTFAHVYAMASSLYVSFSELDDTAIPICLATEDRAKIAAALLAALSSGHTLAFPHSFSKSTLLQMQLATGFCAAIVDPEYDENLPDGTQCIVFDTDCTEIFLPHTKVSVDAIWLFLFTGGSTGAPKLWSKTARNMIGEARFMAARYQISKDDIIAATVTPYHIYGLLFSVLIPLVAAARVLEQTPSFPAEIDDLVQRQAATLLVSVPAHYRALNGRKMASSLRLAFSSAGMLEKKDNDGFYKCNGVGVVEVYGSTETGGLATRNRSAGEEFYSPLDPVVWQIKAERLYVQSPFLSPDIPVNSEGFFLSGDRVQSQGATGFSLHGRADAITKVGGERVDLDEVRDLLHKQPDVQECVVVALPDETGRGNRIAALVCGDAINMSQIKKAMVDSLEPAAFPKRIKKVSTIPIGTNGKYDKEAINSLLLAS